LWNKLASRIAPPVAESLSLGFSGSRVVAIHARADGNRPSLLACETHELPFMPFRDVPSEADRQALIEILKIVAARQRQTYLPIQIAIPDPDALVQLLRFDTLPANRRELRELVRFRLQKEWPAGIGIECTYQPLGRAQDHEQVLGVSIRQDWFDFLKSACVTASLSVGVMDLSVFHLYNRFYDQIAGRSCGAALLDVSAHSWSLLCWDRQFRPQLMRSRWRPAGPDSGIETIVTTVERMIRTYSVANPDQAVEMVYLCAHHRERELLAHTLAMRFQQSCVPCDPLDGVDVGDTAMPEEFSYGAVAAAIAVR